MTNHKERLILGTIFIAFVFLFFVGWDFGPKYTFYPLRQINVSEGQGSSGQFFLLFGSFSSSEKIYYHFYIERVDGSLQIISKSSEWVKIYENEEVAPYAVEKRILVGDKAGFGYELHVPKNSIKYEINLDLKKE